MSDTSIKHEGEASLTMMAPRRPMTALSSEVRMDSSRILVVDWIPAFRAGLIHWLSQEPDLVGCGEADSIAAARLAVAASHPDLVLVDLKLPDGDGLDLLREWTDGQAVVRALVFSDLDEEVYAHRALRAGARGYIMKHADRDQVLEAIRMVLRGKVFLSGSVAAQLPDHLFPDPLGSTPELARLSDRELQVFRLLGSGVRTAEIAKRLKLSPKTVETHREHLKDKLGFRSGTALVRAATLWVDKGIAPASSP